MEDQPKKIWVLSVKQIVIVTPLCAILHAVFNMIVAGLLLAQVQAQRRLNIPVFDREVGPSLVFCEPTKF